jgi:hypothetical protein
VSQVSTPGRVNSTDDQTSFRQTEVLSGALADISSVRPEAVARAQQLIRDSSYPSPQVIRNFSRLLAAALQDQ